MWRLLLVTLAALQCARALPQGDGIAGKYGGGRLPPPPPLPPQKDTAYLPPLDAVEEAISPPMKGGGGYGGGAAKGGGGYGGGGAVPVQDGGGYGGDGGVPPVKSGGGYGGGGGGYGGGGGSYGGGDGSYGGGGEVPPVKSGGGYGGGGYGGDGGVPPVKSGGGYGGGGGGYGGGGGGYGGAGVPPVQDGGYGQDGGAVQGGGYGQGGAVGVPGGEGPPPQGGMDGGFGAGDCVCVPYYQCKEGMVSEDGSGLLDARKKVPPMQEIPLDGLGNNQQCPGVDQICCAEPSAVTEKPYIASCGIRNDNGINSRILTKDGKGEAEFGEWPWQAAVLKYENEILKFECGGTLIGSRFILTVAHCVARFTGHERVPLKVRLGEWDTQSMKEFYPHEDYDVGNIFIHPYFKNSSLWNDIAVLELTRHVNFAPHVSPICLPKLEDVFEGSHCVVTGWGKDAYRTGKFANIMKEVTVPVIDNPMCQNLLRQTRLGRYFRLHEGFICAGTEDGVDSCKGDGGGPLSCYTPDGRYHLAGLVAWGIDCGTPDVPGVYVRVAKYLDWVSEVTKLPIAEFYPK